MVARLSDILLFDKSKYSNFINFDICGELIRDKRFPLNRIYVKSVIFAIDGGIVPFNEFDEISKCVNWVKLLISCGNEPDKSLFVKSIHVNVRI